MHPVMKISLRIGDMNLKHQEQNIYHQDKTLKNPTRNPKEKDCDYMLEAASKRQPSTEELYQDGEY
jgi:hypothetical protein